MDTPTTPRRERISTRRKLEVLCRQGKCPLCEKRLGDLNGVEFDHIVPVALGGSNEYFNLQAVHSKCHKVKTETEDVPRIAKAKRQYNKHNGIETRRKKPIQSQGFDKTRTRGFDGKVRERT